METLGAWLGVWTPPREAEVPPVPWRKIVIGGAVLVVVLGVAAALIVPRVTDTKEQARERERRAASERRAEFLAMVDREQAPRTGRGPLDRGRVRERAALLAAAETAIADDARRRTDREIRGTECEPFPRSLRRADPVEQLSRRAAAYDCVAVTARFRQGDERREGLIGIPFRLVVRFADGRYAWCRIVPLGDRDRLTHPLPDACRL